LKEQLELVDNGTISQDELIANYQSFIQAEITDISMIRSIDVNNTGIWNFTAFGEITLLLGLYNWNSSKYFIRSTESLLTWTFSRDTEYRNGAVLTIIFSIILIVSLVRSKRESVH
jgi:hypothetical protein